MAGRPQRSRQRRQLTVRRSGARQKALRGVIWNKLDGYLLVTNGPPPALNSPPPGQLTGEANTTEAFSDLALSRQYRPVSPGAGAQEQTSK
ncbi:hypothetical protein HaLaN_29616 [Haematococcus lacustris]|uniref:Uncharacterized protein n=1 Tax=Haematococcus lacustris TaxID=44745 RepID=A0A6A0AFT9_HAELA|nr:hypothetical protein HaLaN_29616 [Haematococcus lacustris]